MNVPPIVENSGHLYEAGFMLGVIAALAETNVQAPAMSYFQRCRETFPAVETVDRFVQTIPTHVSQEAGRSLAAQCLMTGRASGYHFLQEYLTATISGWRFATDAPDWQESADWSIPYWQCSLGAAKQLRPTDAYDEEAQERSIWLQQVPQGNEHISDGDLQPGGFLKADLLLYLRDHRRESHHVLVVDTTTSTVGSHFTATDVTIGSELLQLLERDYFYQAEKGLFTRLAIETGETLGTLLSPRLTPYLAAFAGSDRASYKVLQATSYAASFRSFAYRTHLFTTTTPVSYHIIGYANQGMNSLHLRPHETGFLDTCANVYRKNKALSQHDEAFQRTQTRTRVFDLLVDNTAEIFGRNPTFIKAFRDDLPNEGYATFQETLSKTFATPNSTIDPAIAARYRVTVQEMAEASPNDPHSIRAAHAALTWRALDDPDRWLVFLTGYPGIGKTTTVAHYLMRQYEQRHEGFLLLYASPRKTVNRDIFAKFHSEDSTAFFSSRFLGITTNRNVIDDAQQTGEMVVEYLGSASNLPRLHRGIRYLNSAEVDRSRLMPKASRTSPRYTRSAEDVRQDAGSSTVGVIKSVAAATGAALSLDTPNALVAAFSIQAVKRTKDEQDTLKHLIPQLFRLAYLKSTDKFNGDIMRQLVQTTPHIIIMLDEIAGDDSGYEFYRRVVELLQRYRLEQFGFKITLVVADASIMGLEVVRQHLSLEHTGPDARKIYLTMKARDTLAVDTDPISLSLIDATAPESHDGIVINGNAFPADELRITYELRAPVFEVSDHVTLQEQQALIQQRSVLKSVDTALVAAIVAFLDDDHPRKGQLIVYVQNKDRIKDIASRVTEQRQRNGKEFRPRHEYLMIHARKSEQDSRILEDEEQRDRFAVFFMTSSGSRGLTFKNVKRFLIDVPAFAIETNLMEILQLIYRGRGKGNDTGNKDISFFLSGRILLHAQSDREWAIQEGVLDLLTMVALLRLCIVTRIEGATQLGEQQIAAIPMGSKSVSSATRAYQHDLVRLEKVLAHELYGPGVAKAALKLLIKVVEHLMGETTITLRPHTTERTSYMVLYQRIMQAPDSREALLRWITSAEPMQEAFVQANLLVVPMDAGETITTNRMPFSSTITLATNPATRAAIQEILANAFYLTPDTIAGVKMLDEIVRELAETQSSQVWEQREQTHHAFYVVPLAIFAAPKAIASYCQEIQHKDPIAGQALRQILISTIRESYPVETILPLGWKYKTFPYVTITSHDLRTLRTKWVREGYTVMSRELNMLTMLLAYE